MVAKKKFKVPAVTTLNADNARHFAVSAIAKYTQKGMIVDAMLWSSIIGHYDDKIEALTEALRGLVEAHRRVVHGEQTHVTADTLRKAERALGEIP